MRLDAQRIEVEAVLQREKWMRRFTELVYEQLAASGQSMVSAAAMNVAIAQTCQKLQLEVVADSAERESHAAGRRAA